jgi:hypothetical protein
MGLAVAPTFAFARVTVIPGVVLLPETWGLSDYAGYSALVLVVFGLMIRRGLLRTKNTNN